MDEIKEDFPDYFKRLHGYFEIFQKDIELNIIQKIEVAKINSIFL